MIGKTAAAGGTVLALGIPLMIGDDQAMSQVIATLDPRETPILNILKNRETGPSWVSVEHEWQDETIEDELIPL